eukprot:TRINITY_DN609_c0_g1_i3.p1 TRINITY_DN609_c0_g1~~TRINITY_DN609_c0_g1_i3.p1  ORF type:complete len:257 (-),score=35.46 TRINITY_DN609_c0_g1_i3:199-969(-)
MNFPVNFLVFVSMTVAVAGRDLKSFFVGGTGTNIGSAFAQTELTLPNYTPGRTIDYFDTILETNFSSGFGRLAAYRDTVSQTAGPGQQISGGASDIIAQLSTGGFFATGGLGGVNGSSGSVGVNGTIGATFTNTSSDVFSITGPTTPRGSFAYNDGVTGAVRAGLGQVFSQMSNNAASFAAKPDGATASDAVGASFASIVGNDTISFAEGDTFSVSGSTETVSGCEQAAGAAAYGSDVGLDGQSAAACSSRGSFQG